jgi:hypothetical protein
MKRTRTDTAFKNVKPQLSALVHLVRYRPIQGPCGCQSFPDAHTEPWRTASTSDEGVRDLVEPRLRLVNTRVDPSSGNRRPAIEVSTTPARTACGREGFPSAASSTGQLPSEVGNEAQRTTRRICGRTHRVRL